MVAILILFLVVMVLGACLLGVWNVFVAVLTAMVASVMRPNGGWKLWEPPILCAVQTLAFAVSARTGFEIVRVGFDRMAREVIGGADERVGFAGLVIFCGGFLAGVLMAVIQLCLKKAKPKWAELVSRHALAPMAVIVAAMGAGGGLVSVWTLPNMFYEFTQNQR